MSQIKRERVIMSNVMKGLNGTNDCSSDIIKYTTSNGNTYMMESTRC